MLLVQKTIVFGLMLAAPVVLSACGSNTPDQCSTCTTAAPAPTLPLTYTIEPLTGEIAQGKDIPVRCVLTNVSDSPLIVNPDFLHYKCTWSYTEMDSSTWQALHSAQVIAIDDTEESEQLSVCSYSITIAEIAHDATRERLLPPGESLTVRTVLSWPQELAALRITSLTIIMGYWYPHPQSDTARYTEMIPANPITVRIVQ